MARPKWLTMFVLTAALVASAPASADADREGFKIRTLSSPPHLVSGGTALVAVEAPSEGEGGHLRVLLGSRDVTTAFRPGANGSLTGLVADIPGGRSRLSLVEGRHVVATLDVTSYPITGPMISGPHQVPFICQTQNFKLPDGTTLGGPIDADCSVRTRTDYVYLPAGATAFQPLPSTSSLPADVATTTTRSGVTMPFVVRVETGTVNRGIYQTAVLHDPTKEPAPTPFSPPQGWNGHLIAVQGFGCTGGWYIQGAAQGNLSGITGGISLLERSRLGEGYATFANTLQHPSNSCNSLLAGETMVMSKARFIETFGVPRATVSMGCSGGSYTSLQIADAHPGLIDGVLVSCTFPDPPSIALSATDGHLLAHYFTVTNPSGFTDAQKVAVSGYMGIKAWLDAANQSQRTDPVPGRVDIPGYVPAVFNAAVPVDLRYDPIKNPRGIRPTVYDAIRNVYGVDPATGFALRPFDNVGVQYGLEALNAGAITRAQFLDLNERVGGYDQDANYVASRSAGDGGAIRRFQQAGVTLSGGGGLASIPVLDVSGIYNDAGGYHYQWTHFATRDRMRSWNGDTANHVMWRGNPVPADPAWSTFIEWVDAVAADRSEVPARAKVVRNKPPQAVDGCWTGPTSFVAERQTFSRDPDSSCNTLFPSYGFPRLAAGGPVSADNFQCRRKAIDPRDYAVAFTAPELARLAAIFPQGVCDWSRPGRNRARVVPWPSFGPSPVHLVFDVTRPAPEHEDDED
jgi:hypothetical protein